LDICVWVPKSERAHFWEDPPEGTRYEFWSLPSLPRHLSPGDTVWFAAAPDGRNGRIVAGTKIAGLQEQSERCSSTGRTWRGPLVKWRPKDFREVENGRPMKAFRGFKYVTFVQQAPA